MHINLVAHGVYAVPCIRLKIHATHFAGKILQRLHTEEKTKSRNLFSNYLFIFLSGLSSSFTLSLPSVSFCAEPSIRNFKI